MLVTIQQTKSNTENLFEVTSNGQLLFQAKAPWMKISLPFNAEDLRELTFSNPAGEIVYTTRYRFIDNLVEELIPFKYLLTKGQRFGQFEIIGRNGSEGSFYVMQSVWEMPIWDTALIGEGTIMCPSMMMKNR